MQILLSGLNLFCVIVIGSTPFQQGRITCITSRHCYLNDAPSTASHNIRNIASLLFERRPPLAVPRTRRITYQQACQCLSHILPKSRADDTLLQRHDAACPMTQRTRNTAGTCNNNKLIVPMLPLASNLLLRRRIIATPHPRSLLSQSPLSFCHIRTRYSALIDIRSSRLYIYPYHTSPFTNHCSLPVSQPASICMC